MITNNGPKDAHEYDDDILALEREIEKLSHLKVNESVAAQINDFMAKARNLKKSADGDRKAIKEPFLSGGREVDARFKPITTAFDSFVAQAKKILTPYLEEQARIAAEVERKAREEAEAKARAAAILNNDEDVQALAEKAKQNVTLASARAESAGRAGSASGMARTASLRSYWDASITDPYKAAAHYATNPKVMELLTTLAEAEMRADRSKSVVIPGIQFNERKEVA